MARQAAARRTRASVPTSPKKDSAQVHSWPSMHPISDRFPKALRPIMSQRICIARHYFFLRRRGLIQLRTG